jgi:hypothetical protein
LPSTEDRRFEEALRAWAGRPPRTPPEEAARRIAERLPERRPARGPLARPAVRAVVLLAAAVFVLAVGLALFLGPLAPGRSPEPAGAGAAPPAGVPVAPAGDVLVLELDAETTLYMTLQEGDPS